MSDRSFSKEIYLNIQSKPPLIQLEVISSRPVTSYLGEETNTHLTYNLMEWSVSWSDQKRSVFWALLSDDSLGPIL